MKINLSKQDLKEFAKYLQALDTNIEEGDYFNDVLSSASPVSKQKEPFEIKELSVKEYIDNPYYKIVKPSKAKEGNIHLCYDNYKKNQGFVYDEIVLGEFAREKTPFGYFNEDFHFLTLNEKGTTWMSVTPHEINTMKDDIAKAYGNVVTLGLGLGYYPFMVSNKSIVKHVTIIENNQDIINIFNKHILPFSHAKKKYKSLMPMLSHSYQNQLMQIIFLQTYGTCQKTVCLCMQKYCHLKISIKIAISLIGLRSPCSL